MAWKINFTLTRMAECTKKSFLSNYKCEMAHSCKPKPPTATHECQRNTAKQAMAGMGASIAMEQAVIFAKLTLQQTFAKQIINELSTTPQRLAPMNNCGSSKKNSNKISKMVKGGKMECISSSSTDGEN